MRVNKPAKKTSFLYLSLIRQDSFYWDIAATSMIAAIVNFWSMRPILKFFLLNFLSGLLFFVSCKKEYSCENCLYKNQPPIARAGNDSTITLPVDSVALDGSASTDPNGVIAAYAWTKLSGPSSFSIANSNAARTLVTGLVKGVYRFQLKVTDAGGLFSTDTMQVKVVAAPINPLSGREFIFQPIWEIDSVDLGPPGSVLVSINPADSFSISSMVNFPVAVFLQLDTSSVWIDVPLFDWYPNNSTLPSNNGYTWDVPIYPYTSTDFFEIENYPPNYGLAGRYAKVKVKFL